MRNKSNTNGTESSTPSAVNGSSSSSSSSLFAARIKTSWVKWFVLVALLTMAGILVLVLVVLDDSSTASSPSSSASSSSQTTAPPDEINDEPPLFTERGTYRLLNTWPHDPRAFCQGLEVKNETHIYESIGMYSESAMRIVETGTGQVTLETAMPDAFFGEGVTLVDHNIHNVNNNNDDDDDERYLLQLTWREKTAFTYHPETLEEISRFPYETTNGQGWGIAYDTHKNLLYVTDGTEFVHTWQMVTADNGTLSYREIAKVPVTLSFAESERTQTLGRINELEYDPNSRTLLANVWFENAIVRIHIATGMVSKVYDLSSLYTDRSPDADVFNGIAVIPNQPGRLYVTGKYWPNLYHVELVE